MRPLPSSPIAGEVCRTLLAAWNEARGGDLVPLRKTLRPSAVSPILPAMFILDYRGPKDIVYTLVGSGISDALGFEMTGRNYYDFALPEQQPLRDVRWKIATETPCGIYARNRARIVSGLAQLFETIALPIRPDSANRTLQFIGAVQSIPDLNPIVDKKCGPSDQQWHHSVIHVEAIDIGAGAPEMPF